MIVPSETYRAMKGFFEGTILEAQDETSVLRRPGFYLLDAGHPAAHRFENRVEAIPVILVEVLRHLRDVVASGGKVLGESHLGARASLGNVEVGDVPMLDEAAELGDDTELLELPKPLDSEHAGFVEDIILALRFGALAPVHRFVGDRRAPPPREVHEMPRLAILPPAEPENLAVDDRAPAVVRNVEHVGGETPAALAEFEGDADRTLLATAHQLTETAPACHGLRDVLCQCVLQEGEEVDERGLP